MKENNNWYKNGIIYEIYPASFTTQGLQGIISKLEYIKNLGVDAIWLCPIFTSPFRDSGYDISDYYNINEKFGDKSDFIKLINTAHEKGLKIILDIAVNHTSDENPWFTDACKNKDSIYRDYYIFRDGKNGGYPNNWISSKTLKPTWTYNKKTDDYYLHIYTKYQPDLNWRSINMKEAICRILEYWIDMDIDGFRLDVINKIAKPAELQNVKSENEFSDYLYENHVDSHKLIKDMRKKVFDKHDGILMLGQTSGVTVEEGIKYGGCDRGELDLFLQFDHMDTDTKDKAKLYKSIMKWQNIDGKGAWPVVFFGSHDSPRMIDNYVSPNEGYVDIAAKMLCVLQLCLKGTQIIYMGDELALTNVKNTSIDEFIDIRSKDIYSAKLKEGKSEKQIIKELNGITRDNARRQIPWDKAEKMCSDESSTLAFYKKIIAWRKIEEAISYGRTISLYEEDENIFAYQRRYKGVIITVLANMSCKKLQLETYKYGEENISNYQNSYRDKLLPYEAKILKKQVDYVI